MTREQIADLLARTDERCCEGEGINVTKKDVARLLEEREALILVLREIVDQVLDCGHGYMAAKAIRKAEAA